MCQLKWSISHRERLNHAPLMAHWSNLYGIRCTPVHLSLLHYWILTSFLTCLILHFSYTWPARFLDIFLLLQTFISFSWRVALLPAAVSNPHYLSALRLSPDGFKSCHGNCWRVEFLYVGVNVLHIFEVFILTFRLISWRQRQVKQGYTYTCVFSWQFTAVHWQHVEFSAV